MNSTPAIDSLRLSYPGAEIIVLCRPVQADLLHNNPSVDLTIPVDPSTTAGKLDFIRVLRRFRPNLAISLQNAWLTNLAAGLSGAEHRAGWKGKRFSSLLNIKADYRYAKGERHEAARNLDLIKLVCHRLAPLRPRLYLTDEELGVGWEILKVEGLRPDRPWCAIHPGGSSPDKLWTPEGFARIGEMVRERLGMDVALIAGPREKRIAERIASMMRFRPPILLPENVRVLGSILKHASLLICNDSGPMHIAAALGVPTVAIFGPTDHVRWAPLNERARIVRRHMPCFPCSAHKCKRGYECIKALPAEEVWRRVVEVVEGAEHTGDRLLEDR